MADARTAVEAAQAAGYAEDSHTMRLARSIDRQIDLVDSFRAKRQHEINRCIRCGHLQGHHGWCEKGANHG